MQKQLQFRIELHQQTVLAEQEKQFEMKTLTAFDNCCSGLWCHWAKSSDLHYRNIFLNDLKYEHNWKVQSQQNLCRKFAISGKVNVGFFQKSYRIIRYRWHDPHGITENESLLRSIIMAKRQQLWRGNFLLKLALILNGYCPKWKEENYQGCKKKALQGPEMQSQKM